MCYGDDVDTIDCRPYIFRTHMSGKSLVLILLVAGCQSQYVGVTCGSHDVMLVPLEVSVVHLVYDYSTHTVTVCGTISDSTDGTPLCDASVKLLSRNAFAFVDSSGRFCLSGVGAADTLSFLRIGFQRKVVLATKIIKSTASVSGKSVAF